MITIMLNGPGPCTISSFSIGDKKDVEVNMCCVSFSVKAKILNKKIHSNISVIMRFEITKRKLSYFLLSFDC